MGSSPLDFLFGSKVNYQGAPQVDASQAAGQSASFNWGQLGQFQGQETGITQYMQNLFNQQNPQVQQSLNQNFSLGNQLSTQGYSNAQSNALNYYRQQGLEMAANTGAPVSSQFAQNTGNSFGANQILQNQMAGSQLLGQTSQQQTSLGQSFMQPGLGVLSANMTNPATFISAAQGNAQMTNQQQNLQSYANAQANPAGAYLASTVSSILSELAGSAGAMAMA